MNSETITKHGVHPSTHAHRKVKDPGHKGGSGDNEKQPASAPHLHEKKASAAKSGHYSESRTDLSSQPTRKTGSPLAQDQPKGGAAGVLYPTKLGLRGKVE